MSSYFVSPLSQQHAHMFFSYWVDLVAELGLPTAQNQQHNIDRGNGENIVTGERTSQQTDWPSSPVI
jgi:hypothetical protein